MSQREENIELANELELQFRGNISNADLDKLLDDAESALVARAAELEIEHDDVELDVLFAAIREQDPEFSLVESDDESDTSDTESDKTDENDDSEGNDAPEETDEGKDPGKPKKGEVQVRFLRDAVVRDHNDEIEQSFKKGRRYNLVEASAERWIRRAAAEAVTG